jgi:hypothetical protein
MELLKTNIETEDADWVFETDYATWRLLENDKLLTGSCENYKHNDDELKKLIGKKLLSAEYLNKTDINLKFENNFSVTTFNLSTNDRILEVFCFKNTNERTYWILENTGEWKEEDPDVPCAGLTEIEKIESQHSENCYNRWKNIAPQDSFDNHCRDCAYFLPNSGRFYFGDFGLCSNGESIYDGRVVGVKSSCEHYDDELQT